MQVRRIVSEMGYGAAAAITAAYPDIEVVNIETDTPPADLTADVFLGGYGPPERLRAWIHGTQVQWVQLIGTGIERLPSDIIESHTVCCARGASAVPISEFVLAQMLAFEKHLPDIWLHEPPEHWNLTTLGGLSDRNLALVGIGGIGQAVATRALAFGMNVKALRRTNTPSPIPGVDIVTTLAELVDGADHVVIAAPATANTTHLFDAAAFAAMKPGAHLVNIARGTLVDQDALRVALDTGQVALASLDTVTPEPLPAGHWLYSHPQVHLTAHVSWASHKELTRPIELLLENIRRARADEPLHGLVNAGEGY
jgi:phosphoglycerate dehydrogenase-like enzyme